MANEHKVTIDHAVIADLTSLSTTLEDEKELMVLIQIDKEDGLTPQEMISLAEGKKAAFNLRLLSNLPQIDPEELRSTSSAQKVKSLVKKRIKELENTGVKPLQPPELNAQIMNGFLSKITKYLITETSLPIILSIFEARKNIKEASLIYKIPNIIINSVFKGIIGGNFSANLGNQLIKRSILGVSSILTSTSIKEVTGISIDKTINPVAMFLVSLSQLKNVSSAAITSAGVLFGQNLGLTAKDAKILGFLIMGLLKSGSLAAGVTDATKKMLYFDLLKATGAKKSLKEMDFLSAGGLYLTSKYITDFVVSSLASVSKTIVNSTVEKTKESAISSIISNDAINTTAMIVTFTVILSLRNYLNSDETSKNPGIIKTTTDNLTKIGESIKSNIMDTLSYVASSSRITKLTTQLLETTKELTSKTIPIIKKMKSKGFLRVP